MFNSGTSLAEFDPEISAAIEAERTRQEEHIELIASENHTSPFVMEAQGSVVTNKYAEGYPAKRYYGGCENVDVVEDLAIKVQLALIDGNRCPSLNCAVQSIVKGDDKFESGIPESFNVLVNEIKSLGLDIDLN